MSFTGRPESFLETTVANNGFFPVLPMREFQETYRVPAELAESAVARQLVIARDYVNDQLSKQQAQWQSQAHASLEAVDIAEGAQLVEWYKDAVFNRAKAHLLTDFETFTRRASAAEISDDADPISQSLLARAKRALRRLRGQKGTITAELL